MGAMVSFNLLVLVLNCLQLQLSPSSKPLWILEITRVVDSLMLLGVESEEVFLGGEKDAGGWLLA